MEKKRRENSDGCLLVVGGPGGSGSTVISERLAKYFGLKRIYAGALFREAVLEKGYEKFEDFYRKANEEELLKLDMEVDRKLLEESKSKGVLIESKIFAAILEMKDLPCTARIWLDASLHVRTLRHLKRDNTEKEGFLKRVVKYFRVRGDLKKRWVLDRRRYSELYGVDYSKPKLYNDIVIDSSKINEDETFNLILKRLKDGRYVERGSGSKQ
jgi:predicted cytidylate kinase